MNKYTILMDKSDACYEAARRCFRQGCITMGRIWQAKAQELCALARAVFIGEVAE
jgi:hypothetical protein